MSISFELHGGYTCIAIAIICATTLLRLVLTHYYLKPDPDDGEK